MGRLNGGDEEGRGLLSAAAAPPLRSRYGGVDAVDGVDDGDDVLRVQTPRISGRVVGVVRRVVTGLTVCACVVAALSRTMQGGDRLSATMLGRALRTSESGYQTMMESNPSPVSAGYLNGEEEQGDPTSVASLGDSLPGPLRNITLTTGCSPLDFLRFDTRGWTGAVGATLVTKDMSNGLKYLEGRIMDEVYCGTYHISVPMRTGVEFTFWLYPKYEEGEAQKHDATDDCGCAQPGTGPSAVCSERNTPAPITTSDNKQCVQAFAVSYSDGSHETFYNRVYQGEEKFVWGSCQTHCGKYQPPQCPKCKANEHVVNHKCVKCPPGTESAEGLEPGGPDTECVPILCNSNERVINHNCEACPPGSTSDAGADASQGDSTCTPTLCQAHTRVSNNVCTPCGPGSENAAGDDASGDDTQCDPQSCGINERVVNHACQACPIATTNEPGDDASGDDTQCDPILCPVNQFVQNHACVSCPVGHANEAGDDASGDDTQCDAVLCEANEHVSDHKCVACAPGTVRSAGDAASSDDTACEPVLCAINEHVSNHQCVSCAPGTTNAENDDASGADTTCTAKTCLANEHVSGHACVACPAGTTNDAGDDASGDDTACLSTLCSAHEHVVNHICTACVPGKENEAGDDASGDDTSCDAVVCGKDMHVQNHQCVSCPKGHHHEAGDIASGDDTDCDVVYCHTNEHVIAHACQACPPGTTNEANDVASSDDTQCDPILCPANQFVQNHACVSCPVGHANEAGDDASGDDTQCDAVLCEANEHVSDHKCVACAPGTVRSAGDAASSDDTACEPVLCAINEHVSNHQCVSCQPGATRNAGDDSSGADTTCTAKTCLANEHVSGHACVACPAGTTNDAGDDASGDDTECDKVICGAHQHVQNHACHACPAGTNNPVREEDGLGDDASGGDTKCATKLCRANEHVANNACVVCPAGSVNDAGDAASGTDTVCDSLICLANQHVSNHVCVPCKVGYERAAGDPADRDDTECTKVQPTASIAVGGSSATGDVEPNTQGVYETEVIGDPGVNADSFNVIATAYGTLVHNDVRQVSWVADSRSGRTARLHAAASDEFLNKPHMQPARVAYMFTLNSVRGQGAVVGVGNSECIVSSSRTKETYLEPVQDRYSFDTTSLDGKLPVILMNSRSQNDKGVFTCNVYGANAQSGQFKVSVGRTDKRDGWTDDSLKVSYVALTKNAPEVTKDIFAAGEIKVPPPESDVFQTYSSVKLEHNLNTTDYQCLATVRVDTNVKPDRQFIVECQGGTPNTITLTIADHERRSWVDWRDNDNVYVMYALIPNRGSTPLISVSEYTGDYTKVVNPPDGSRSASSVYRNEALGTGHNRGMLGSVQGWSSRYNVVGQWYQMTLAGVVQVAGIAMQGRDKYYHRGGQWVRSFKVKVSTDGVKWYDVDGGISFIGNVDMTTQRLIYFSKPVEAHAVRIYPQTWNNHMSMRCGYIEANHERVLSPVVLNVAESARTKSGVYGNDRAGTSHDRGRLSSVQAWSSQTGSSSKWYTMDAGAIEEIAGVVLRGRWYYNQYVTNFQAQTSVDGSSWRFVEGGKHFQGCANWHDEVQVHFNESISARYLKVIPVGWYGYPSLRTAMLVNNRPPELIMDPDYNHVAASSVWENDRIGYKHGRGRLDSPASWSARYNDRNQWYQMDLGAVRNVTGVITIGRQDYDQWVTQFKAKWSADGRTWHDVEDGVEYAANFDRYTPVKTHWAEPVEARYIRILPLHWRHHISMRAGILIEEPKFWVKPVPEIIEDPDYDHVAASSVWENARAGTRLNQGRLDSPASWSARYNDRNQWYQMDLGAVRNVTGIITRGRGDYDQWVTQFQAKWCADGRTWHDVDSGFEFFANFDRHMEQKNNFASVVQARWIRILPTGWRGHISMRAGILIEDPHYYGLA